MLDESGLALSCGEDLGPRGMDTPTRRKQGGNRDSHMSVKSAQVVSAVSEVQKHGKCVDDEDQGFFPKWSVAFEGMLLV